MNIINAAFDMAHQLRDIYGMAWDRMALTEEGAGDALNIGGKREGEETRCENLIELLRAEMRRDENANRLAIKALASILLVRWTDMNDAVTVKGNCSWRQSV